MDGSRFDTLTRSLSTVGSRRGALGGLLLGVLGLLGSRTDETAAHDPSKKCKKKSGSQKKKCVKKAKKHNVQHAIEVPPPATCSDGIRNGSESDIDCGGSCPRCATGKSCASRADCLSAFCLNNVCQDCNAGAQAQCGAGCWCHPSLLWCVSNRDLSGRTCDDCPAGTRCYPRDQDVACLTPCGAS